MSLVLRKESLAELTDDDLAAVNGADAIPTVAVLMCLTLDRRCILTTAAAAE